jgi:SAM-dependent methyltransferase
MEVTGAYLERLLEFQSRPTWVDEANRLLDALDVISGERVLDFGCGPGGMLPLIEQRNAVAYGCDRDYRMVKYVAGVFGQAQVLVYDGNTLPYQDGQFDVVVASHVLPHVGQPEESLRELARVTREGGRLGVICPNYWHWLLRWPSNRLRGYQPDPSGVWEFTAGSMSSLAQRAGWDTEKTLFDGEYFTPLPSIEQIRSRFVLILRRR